MVTDIDCRADRLVVELITSRAGVHAIRREWDALWTMIPGRTPFQSTAWLLPWWDVFGRGELRVLAVSQDSHLVGLVPLYSSEDGTGLELRLIGAGISDYLDLLAAPGAETVVIDALRRFLNADADWTAIYFDRVPPGSPLLAMRSPDNVSDVQSRDEPCPVLPLPPDRDVRQLLGTRMNKELRYCRRSAERYGAVNVRYTSQANVAGMLSTLFDLHTARWSGKGEAGVLWSEQVRAFHRRAVPALLAAGLLRMHALSVGDETAAVYYGAHAGGRAFFYLGGFHPSFSAISPGKLVVATAIEDAIREHATSFDFLGGQEAYKYEWNAIDQPRFKRHITRTMRTPQLKRSTLPR
jgi:CelD/BcsL family acetyltransferase involved in cellulose biosynthesis